MIVNSTGRKWEFTFTTLVTFGGAFFASFPLFYSTSFGGAYWVWMLLLVSFVLQAVAYEFSRKAAMCSVAPRIALSSCSTDLSAPSCWESLSAPSSPVPNLW